MNEFDHEDLHRAREEGFALGFYAYHAHLVNLTPFTDEDAEENPKIRKFLKKLNVLGSTALENLDYSLIEKMRPITNLWEGVYEKESEAEG